MVTKPTKLSGMVVSNISVHRYMPRSPRIKLVVLVAMVAVVGGLSGWLMTSSSTSGPLANNKLASPGAGSNGSAGAQQSLFEQADALRNSGKYAQAQKLLDSSLANAPNKQQQSRVYEDKALTALNVGNCNDALNFAQKSYELYPSEGSAQVVGHCAEQLNNKPLALDYYKKAFSQLVAAGAMDDSTYVYLQNKIKQLGG